MFGNTSYSYNSPTYNHYPKSSYWLLGDSYRQTDSYVLNTTSDEKWMNCKDACNDCRICKSVNPFYQQCWRSCDRCRYCHLRDHKSSMKRDPPYYMRHPYTPDPDYIDHSLAKFHTTAVCGPKMYEDWVKQYNNYMQCKRCQQQDKCWSQYQQRCIDCDEGHLAKSCEDKFGCPNPINPYFPSVKPINPQFTDCRPCWYKGYNTL